MGLVIDSERGKKVAELLYNLFSTVGIHGRNDMPEDIIPKGVIRGSLEHLMFITLTVSIDYQRDSSALWNASRKTFEDPETRYLFESKALHKTPPGKVIKDMQKYGLSKKPRKYAYIWRTVGITFYKKWNGNPVDFLQNCNWDAPIILERLKKDFHLYNGWRKPDYPYLRGNKIGPLWLRMLRDNIGITKLKNLDKVPIPVDIHVARATLTTGVVRGQFKGNINDFFKYVRKAWSESVKDLNAKNRPMIALDIDEPLWHLSKYGCTKRDKDTGKCPLYHQCEMKEFCIKGRVKIKNSIVEVDT